LPPSLSDAFRSALAPYEGVAVCPDSSDNFAVDDQSRFYNDIVDLKTALEERMAGLEDEVGRLREQSDEKFKEACPDTHGLKGGEWPPESQFTFENAVKNWEARGRPGGPSRVADRLLAELPDRTRQEMTDHLLWFDALKSKKRRDAATAVARARREAEAVRDGMRELRELQQSIRATAGREVAGRIGAELRRERAGKAAAVRSARRAAAAVATELCTRAAEEKEQEAEEEHRRRSVVKERVRLKVRERADVLAARAEQQRKEAEKNRRREEDARKKRMKENNGRIKFREAEIDKRNEERKKILELQQTREDERLEALRAIAAQVPYYDAILSVTADVHRTTAARVAGAYAGTPLDDRSDFQRGPAGLLRTFDDARFLSDPCFRLAAALHEAGVAQSHCARALVKEMVPRVPERTTGIMPH